MSVTALVALAAMSIVSASCNKKDEASEIEDYITTESLAVTAFSLKPDLRVMKNLDSVFFSIDLEHGVIFNADSLPKGTNVTKLIPNITYPSSVGSAVIEMTGGTHRQGTSNYYSNASDTIDFTGKVTLTLGNAANTLTRTYVLKVNVHKEDPDTVYWDRLATADLPSRRDMPKAQKSVEWRGGVACLVQESDDTYTLSTTSDIFAGSWTRNELSAGFTPDVRSLVSDAVGTLYLLDADGTLHTSADGLTWDAVDNGWTATIGMYGETLLGLAKSGDSLIMKSWPRGNVADSTLPAGFPAEGYSNAIEFTNRWTPYPTLVVFGGASPSGLSGSWAFDGSRWADISESAIPAISGLSVMPYYSYLNSASNGLLREFEVYLAFGGRKADGTLNDTVYVSYDHGINWQTAQKFMQLPASVEAGWQLDALAIGTTLESNLSNLWKKSGRRVDFKVENDVIIWECPYIFLFGGYDSGMTLNDRIRCGVLQRLTFAPLF